MTIAGKGEKRVFACSSLNPTYIVEFSRDDRDLNLQSKADLWYLLVPSSLNTLAKVK